MNEPFETTATVDPDGVLRVPLGTELANTRVHVMLNVAREDTERTPRPEGFGSGVYYPRGFRKMNREEWKEFIDSTAGSISDPRFGEPPDLPLQDRGPLFDKLESSS